MLAQRCRAHLLTPSRSTLSPSTAIARRRCGLSHGLLAAAGSAPASIGSRSGGSRTMVTLPDIFDGTVNTIVAAHSVSGLPWYVLIPGLAATLTVCARLPFKRRERDAANRMVRLGDLRLAWYRKAVRLGLDNPQKRADREFSRIQKEAGLGIFRQAVAPLLLHLPAWILLSQALRVIAGQGKAAPLDPSLATEGLLWFPDLTVADPTYILPAIFGASMLYNAMPRSMDEVRRLFDPKVSSFSIRARRALLFVIPFMMTAVISFPSGVVLFWVSSAASNRVLTIVMDRFFLPTKLQNPQAVERYEIDRLDRLAIGEETV
ncbi:unnamed protein product [Parascedosporium putredinis]|uniref:Membrane insertase YidC/Oxa/ALB C-terminal domain-containing protein n=1 Tax=Parascedosporium putredinis TaxID=1442378 RepID=A0A9P1H7D0_9PEZI|nr:unnamed protein product [Parascedosporium putredinis]CAI8001127.1 unnamed protein product [Parascedosporium putredinis]